MRRVTRTGTLACLAGVLALVSACADSGDEPDFGAKVVARFISDAETQCAELKIDTIFDCANSPAQSNARKSARAASEALSTFGTSCRADLGTARCDELLARAVDQSHYLRAP